MQAETTAIQTLSAEGARKFLVVNVPDVGAIPEFTQDNPALAANATAYGKLYDSELATGLAGLTLAPGTSLIPFGLFAYNAQILGVWSRRVVTLA